MNYILNDKEPIQEPDFLKWARWYQSFCEQDKKHVCKTLIPDKYFISTVFLGMDHAFAPGAPPLLFETMVFLKENGDQEWDQYMDRYSTWREAELGHSKICTMLRNNEQCPAD